MNIQALELTREQPHQTYMQGPFMLHAADPGLVVDDLYRNGSRLSPLDADRMRAARHALHAQATRVMAERLKAMNSFIHAQWFV